MGRKLKNLNDKIITTTVRKWMMSKVSLVFLVLLLFACNVHCKESIIIFESTINERITLFNPIDNSVNFYKTPSFEIVLQDDLQSKFNPKFENFSFFQIKRNNGRRYSLLMLQGDSIVVKFENDKLFFSGDNAEGQVYLNNFRRSVNVDSVFEQHLQGGINFYKIRNDLKSLFYDGLTSDINQLVSTNKITSEFGFKIFQDMNYAVSGMFVSSCLALIEGLHKVELTKSDTLAIHNALDSLFRVLPPEESDALKYRYSYSYLSKYYRLKYNNLTTLQKKELYSGWTESTFGPYAIFLLSPDFQQLPLLGSAFLIQLDYAMNEFDKESMYRFLNQKFTNSQYIKLINERYQRNNEAGVQFKKEVSENDVIIINSPVNSLTDLSSVPELKGKNIYIDIWATWCIPCKTQFKFNKNIESLSDEHDFPILYISIDDKKMENRWKNEIKEFELKGFHVLANENLLKDIKKQIYKNQTIIIPRYIFLNKNGEIINSNLSRPQEIENLTSEIQEIMKL